MIKRFLARHMAVLQNAVINSLTKQLAEAKAEGARRENNYLVLVDEHADLRVAFEKLANLRTWGPDVDSQEHADGDEHPEKDKGLSGHRRRSAPTAGDR